MVGCGRIPCTFPTHSLHLCPSALYASPSILSLLGRRPRAAHLHKRFDGTVLCDGDGETKRLKAGLGHPAGDHGGARVVVRSSDHVQAARDTRNGLELVTADGLELSETVLASERLREIGSCLLKRLVQRLRYRERSREQYIASGASISTVSGMTGSGDVEPGRVESKVNSGQVDNWQLASMEVDRVDGKYAGWPR